MTEPEKSLAIAADFPSATREQWRELVAAALKDAPFERLETQTHDGLPIEPLYTRAPAAHAVPGRAPGAAWTLMQRIDHPDATVANAQALDDLNNGATGLMLTIAGSVGGNGFGLDTSTATLARVFDGLYFDAGIVLDVDLAPFARQDPQHVADLVKERTDPAKTNIRFGYDPVSALAISGKAPLHWAGIAPLMTGLIHTLAKAGFKGPFAVGDGRVIHNAGGSEAQELAYALSSAVIYLRALEASGMALTAARDAIYFRLAADADQFLTIAKFRAARKLWARIEDACGLSPKPVIVAAETAWRMMGKRDAYVNMLRTTIAVAGAGLGGADSITVLPHTAPLGLPDPPARRIARNIQLVLLEESNLARVADPAAGSGALEALAQQLCTAAWSLFQEIEKTGGAWTALESGLIQRKVAAVRADRQKAIANRTDILTGINEFPDFHETPPAILDVAPVAPLNKIPATITIAALPRIRLAEPFERLRESSDKIFAQTGARPKVFLAALGTPAEFTARTTFARNFFEAGGIEAVTGTAMSEPAEAVAIAAAFAGCHAALACICGADNTYEREAAATAAALRAVGARHIYLAGRPGASEAAWRDAGVATFIYNGSDALAVLETAYRLIAGG